MLQAGDRCRRNTLTSVCDGSLAAACSEIFCGREGPLNTVLSCKKDLQNAVLSGRKDLQNSVLSAERTYFDNHPRLHSCELPPTWISKSHVDTESQSKHLPVLFQLLSNSDTYSRRHHHSRSDALRLKIFVFSGAIEMQAMPYSSTFVARVNLP